MKLLAIIGAGAFGLGYFGILVDAYAEGLTLDNRKHAVGYAALWACAAVCLAVVIGVFISTVLGIVNGGAE